MLPDTQTEVDEPIKMDLGFSTGSKSSKHDDRNADLCIQSSAKKFNFLKAVFTLDQAFRVELRQLIFIHSYGYKGCVLR